MQLTKIRTNKGTDVVINLSAITFVYLGKDASGSSYFTLNLSCGSSFSINETQWKKVKSLISSPSSETPASKGVQKGAKGAS